MNNSAASHVSHSSHPSSGISGSLISDRYETRYLISPDMIESISQFLEIHCDLDPFSLASSDSFYQVHNVYFATTSRVNSPKKLPATEHAFHFDMRVRSYGAHNEPPYFFEIKYQIADFVKKKRSCVLTEDWAEVFMGHGSLENMTTESRAHLDDFIFVAGKYKMKPAMVIQHQRKAYNSRAGFARVTIDKDIRKEEIDKYGSSSTLSSEVLLELKWQGQMPYWMFELLEIFNLREVIHYELLSGLPSYTQKSVTETTLCP